MLKTKPVKWTDEVIIQVMRSVYIASGYDGILPITPEIFNAILGSKKRTIQSIRAKE